MNVALRKPMSLAEWMSEVVMEWGHLALPEIDTDIPLAELYADIDLSAPPEGETEDA